MHNRPSWGIFAFRKNDDLQTQKTKAMKKKKKVTFFQEQKTTKRIYTNPIKLFIFEFLIRRAVPRKGETTT